MDEKLLSVKSLLLRGDVEEALNTAKSITDPYWRSYALRWVVEGYTETPEKALEVAAAIEVPSIRDEAFRTLTYIFSKKGDFKLALEAARRIKNQFIRKKAFRTVSNYLAKAVVSSGAPEVRLSDLKLDENDINDLKPLPYGLVYKDGKIMPGAEILPLKGEVREGIIERFEKRLEGRTPPKPAFAEKEMVENEYVIDYARRLIERGNLEEARKIAKGLPEPIRSVLLEEIGVRLLKAGNVEGAEEIFQELLNEYGEERELSLDDARNAVHVVLGYLEYLYSSLLYTSPSPRDS
jgi:tetratricopeptide (TPR) repeat protein